MILRNCLAFLAAINENADDDITTYLYHRRDRRDVGSHNHMIYYVTGDDRQQIDATR